MVIFSYDVATISNRSLNLYKLVFENYMCKEKYFYTSVSQLNFFLPDETLNSYSAISAFCANLKLVHHNLLKQWIILWWHLSMFVCHVNTTL